MLGCLDFIFPDDHRVTIALKNGDTVRVGRSPDSHVVIDNPSVSRRHASFDCSSIGITVADLSSLNGTYLNGELISSMRDLLDGDVVHIGPVKVLVRIEESPATALPVPMPASRPRSTTVQLSAVAVTLVLVNLRQWRLIRQRLASEHAEEFTHTWNNTARGIVERYHGCLDKVVDDTILAFWSNPEGRVGAERALMAARELHGSFTHLAQSADWPSRGSLRWQISTVLASGRALAPTARMPLTQLDQFTLMGEPLTLAFAIEAQVQTLGRSLLMDELTANLISGNVEARHMGQIRVGPRSREEAVYSL